MPMSMVIVACAVCFALGGLSLVLLVGVLKARDQTKRRRIPTQVAVTKKAPLLARIGTMNLILMLIGAALLIFTVVMVRLFRETGGIPDTLVNCVFAALGGECGVMGWIKTTKEKSRDRQWEQEDRANGKDRG